MTRIINSVSRLLEGKVQWLESVKRTLEEKMSLLQRLDGEIIGLKEEQEIWNEIERFSDIRLEHSRNYFSN